MDLQEVAVRVNAAVGINPQQVEGARGVTDHAHRDAIADGGQATLASIEEDVGGMEKSPLWEAAVRTVSGVGVENEFPEYGLVWRALRLRLRVRTCCKPPRFSDPRSVVGFAISAMAKPTLRQDDVAAKLSEVSYRRRPGLAAIAKKRIPDEAEFLPPCENHLWWSTNSLT